MGLASLTVPSLSRAHSKARKLSKIHGIRWAASFLCAVGIPLETARKILLAK